MFSDYIYNALVSRVDVFCWNHPMCQDML